MIDLEPIQLWKLCVDFEVATIRLHTLERLRAQRKEPSH